MNATDLQIAWAAGLFEGEGSISASKRSDGFIRFASLSLTMIDEDIVARFTSIVGGSYQWYFYGEKGHVKYQWQTNKWSEVQRIYWMLHPHLGERRRARAAELFAEYVGCRS